MKKIILSIILSVLFLNPSAMLVAGGGDSFVGGMAGGMLGGVISGAMTKDSSGRDAKRDVQQLRQEQQLRREMSGQQQAGFITVVVIIAFILMFLAIVGLGVMVLRKKKGKE